MDVIAGVFLGGNFSDPTNERLIVLSALALVLLGVGLLLGTIVWWRRGREENPVLAPLEVMGMRGWAKGSDAERRRRLDEVRVAGAGGASGTPALADPVDLEELMRSDPQAFDDLREPGVAVELPSELGALLEVADVAEIAEPSTVPEGVGPEAAIESVDVAVAAEVAAKPRTTTRSRSKPKADAAAPAAAESVEVVAIVAAAQVDAKPRASTRSKTNPKVDAATPIVADGVEVAVAAEVTAKPRTTTRSRSKPKVDASAPAAAESVEVATLVDVDATSISTERPPDDLAPASNGQTSASTTRSSKPRKSASTTANGSGAARKSPSADPLL